MPLQQFRLIISSIRFRLILLFAIICFLPFLRECGDVSYGFPFPVMNGKPGWDQYESTLFPSLLINISILTFLYFLTIRFFKRIGKETLDLWLRVILIYHAVIVFSYGLFYPVYSILYQSRPETGFLNSVLSGLMVGLYYLINPFSGLLKKIPFLVSWSKELVLFGDPLDIISRLNYMLEIGLLSAGTRLIPAILKQKSSEKK